MGFNNFSDELAVLEIVRSANFVRPGKLTSGQISRVDTSSIRRAGGRGFYGHD